MSVENLKLILLVAVCINIGFFIGLLAGRERQ